MGCIHITTSDQFATILSPEGYYTGTKQVRKANVHLSVLQTLNVLQSDSNGILQ